MKSISRETVQRLYTWDPQAAIAPDLNNYDPALSVEKNLNNAHKHMMKASGAR